MSAYFALLIAVLSRLLPACFTWLASASLPLAEACCSLERAAALAGAGRDAGADGATDYYLTVYAYH